MLFQQLKNMSINKERQKSQALRQRFSQLTKPLHLHKSHTPTEDWAQSALRRFGLDLPETQSVAQTDQHQVLPHLEPAPQRHHLCTWNRHSKMNTIVVHSDMHTTFVPETDTHINTISVPETARETWTPSLYKKKPVKHKPHLCTLKPPHNMNTIFVLKQPQEQEHHLCTSNCPGNMNCLYRN